MPYDLILDVVLAILLVITIGYALVLNKRLGMLRNHKAELERLAGTFTESTSRAGESIGQLKIASDALQSQLARAESLRDDLVFLIDRGTVTADRLEENVRVSRDEFGVVPKTAMPEAPAAAAAPAPRPAPDPLPEPGSGLRGKGHEEPMPERSFKQENRPRSEAERELLKAIRSAG